MICPHASPLFTLAALSALAMAAPAAAQSNVLFLKQSGVANVIALDQSTAIGSTAGAAGAPLTQAGIGNRLTITDTGRANVIAPVAQNNVGGAGSNVADITLGARTDAATVGVVQGADATGALTGGNIAVIDLVFGTGATIVQNGADNRADLTVDGAGASGSITQNGSRNEGALTVVGIDTAVNLTQNGNDIAFDGGAAGLDLVNGVPGGITVVGPGGGVTVNIVQTAN